MPKTFVLILCSLVLCGLLPGCSLTKAIDLNVSAAASLTDALQEVNALFLADNPDVTVSPNFASSGTLQAQIQNGGKVDVFLSAAPTQMDNLQQAGLILNSTRKDLLTNRVVLVVPLDSIIDIDSFTGLVSDKINTIAIGDPKFVPAGTYAREAFDELGITSQIQPKLVLCADVRQVLSYVESGNVEAGIVYATDANISDRVKIIAAAPENINARIVFPVAIIASSSQVDAATKYEDFLFSPRASDIFKKYGFATPGR